MKSFLMNWKCKAMILKYVDISKYQKEIDFAKLAKAVDGVIIRAGYGKNVIDPYFHRNAQGCTAHGIPFGVYWFSYAVNAAEARQEARDCLAAIKHYRVELPVCFDFEYDSVRNAKEKGVTITKALASEIAIAFCSEVEAAGYFAMNYANADYVKNYFTAEVFNRFALWYARYPKAPQLDKPPCACGIWQYTSSGTVDGINGYVDLNVSYNDYRAIIAKAGLNNLGEQTEQPQEWYSEAQAWAMAQGITDGSKPTEPATRAEVWAMLHRLNGGR